MMSDENLLKGAGKKPDPLEAYYAQLDKLLNYMPYLFDMISLTLELEPGPQEPHPPGTRYRIETFPARYARVMRQPRKRLYDLESAELSTVYRLLSWGVNVEDLVEAASEREETWYEELDLDLQAHAGKTFADVTREIYGLLGRLSETQLPSASELPYRAEFGRIFGHLSTIADHFITQRTLYRLPEPDATARVMEMVSSRGPRARTESVIATPDGIGKLRMMLATTRAEDGSELGLAHPAAPAEGWLAWYRSVLDRVQELVRENNASLDPAIAMVTAPTDVAPPEPPGLADPRYSYAARFVAAYEGAPITDTEQQPSPESRRFDRAHIAIWLLFTDAYELVFGQVSRLLADAESNPRLLEATLGMASADHGRDLGKALSAAIQWYLPNDPPQGVPSHPWKSFIPPGDPGSLQELPMNRWEVRFRYPELLDLCSRLPSGGGTGGLDAAVASFITAREPRRVWLPPVVGELHEIVNLLPFDRDLGYAMAHLGASDYDGAAWRSALLRAADDITAHIWAHEDHPG